MNKNIKNYINNETKLLDEEYDLICKLVQIRKSEGLSQRNLCKLINFNQPTLAKIEKSKQSPGLNTLIKLLSTMGYRIDFVKNK